MKLTTVRPFLLSACFLLAVALIASILSGCASTARAEGDPVRDVVGGLVSSLGESPVVARLALESVGYTCETKGNLVQCFVKDEDGEVTGFFLRGTPITTATAAWSRADLCPVFLVVLAQRRGRPYIDEDNNAYWTLPSGHVLALGITDGICQIMAMHRSLSASGGVI